MAATEHLTSLTYAVRGRVVGKYLGQLGLVLALLTLVPLAVALGTGDTLDLPDESRMICLYRDGKFRLPEADTKLQPGDEVIVLTHSRNLAKLQQRWWS